MIISLDMLFEDVKKGYIMNKKCAKCGALLEDDAMFCGECGEPWTEENDDDVLENYGPIGVLEELRITEDILINSGQTKTFKNYKVIFSARIKAEEDAKLQFINCDISVSENAFDKFEGKISVIHINGVEVIFDKCAFRNIDKGFIKAYKGIKSEDRVNIQGCIIDVCDKILDASYDGSISIRNSYIHLTSGNEMYGLARCKNIELYNTKICGRGEKRKGVYCLFDRNELLRLEKCFFSNIPNLSIGMSTDATDCDFENCDIEIDHVKVGGRYQYNGGGLFKNCLFKNCVFERVYSDCVIRFESSKFLDCIGQLPTVDMKDVVMDGGFLVLWQDKEIKLQSCQFSNWSYKYYRDTKNKNGCYIFLGEPSDESVIATKANSVISNCKFANMDLGNMSLIGCYPLEYSACEIKDCQFSNISTGSDGILKRHRTHWKRGLFSSKSVTETLYVSISNCDGL